MPISFEETVQAHSFFALVQRTLWGWRNKVRSPSIGPGAARFRSSLHGCKTHKLSTHIRLLLGTTSIGLSCMERVSPPSPASMSNFHSNQNLWTFSEQVSADHLVIYSRRARSEPFSRQWQRRYPKRYTIVGGIRPPPDGTSVSGLALQ